MRAISLCGKNVGGPEKRHHASLLGQSYESFLTKMFDLDELKIAACSVEKIHLKSESARFLIIDRILA